jgi:hypothetical protein
MSRPAPTVLRENTNKETYDSEQVLLSDGIWAVYYDGQPINLKTLNLLKNLKKNPPKYKKVSFSNPGHAINLAKKLNTEFKTDLFVVMKLIKGQQVYP